jgi:transcriptional regulator with XRE-family HTH domain
MKAFRLNMRAYADAAKRAGYKYGKIATSAGYSKGHWSDLLSGKIPNPSVATAARVAKALRVTVNDLLIDDRTTRARTAFAVERMFKKGIKHGK